MRKFLLWWGGCIKHEHDLWRPETKEFSSRLPCLVLIGSAVTGNRNMVNRDSLEWAIRWTIIRKCALMCLSVPAIWAKLFANLLEIRRGINCETDALPTRINYFENIAKIRTTFPVCFIGSSQHHFSKPPSFSAFGNPRTRLDSVRPTGAAYCALAVGRMGMNWLHPLGLQFPETMR